jgi:hypothetical protein
VFTDALGPDGPIRSREWLTPLSAEGSVRKRERQSKVFTRQRKNFCAATERNFEIDA